MIKRILLTAAALFAFVGIFIGSIRLYQTLAAKAPEHTTVFSSGDEGSKYYRIPALAVALDGTIVAVADRRWDSTRDLPSAIDVVCRRSTDKGKTWGEQIVIASANSESGGFGDAALVLERNSGDLVCIFGGGPGLWASTRDCPARVYVSRSSDSGLSWSEPLDLTETIYSSPAMEGMTACFAASGSATQFEDGTLAFVLAAFSGQTPFYNFLCLSRDGGYNWEVLPATPGRIGDESKVAELPGGDLLMSIRHGDPQPRRYSYSHDRGLTWEPYGVWPEIAHSSCNGDLLRYEVPGRKPKDFLLQSFPGDSLERKNTMIALSFDNGRTWPVRKRIFKEELYTGYSSIAILKDGTIGMLTELSDGTAIYFSRFNLTWLDD